MKPPPTIASAILRQFIPPHDPRVGDLLEGFQAGKSRWWYSRQAVAIIASSISTEVQRHPIITLRAIALGFAFTWVMWRYVMSAVMNYDELLFATGLVPWFYTRGYGLSHPAIWAATAVLYGLSGWIVGRVSRESAATVLVYAAVGEFLFFVEFGMWRFISDSLPYPLLLILTAAIRPLPTLFGGLWAVSRRNPSERRFRA